MKKPTIFQTLLTMNALVAVMNFALAGYLIWLLPHVRGENAAETADAREGIRLAIWVMVGAGMLWVAAAYLMKRRWRAGWWYGLLLNMGAAIVCVADILGESSIDWSELVIPLYFVVVSAMFILNAVRREFFGGSRTESPQSS